MNAVDNKIEERIFVLAKTYSLIEKFFGHWNYVEDLNLDQEFQKFVMDVFACENRYDFDLLMMKFIAKLRNGHSWFSDTWLTEHYGQSLGFSFSKMENQWIITQSQHPHLEVGDEIKAIDSQNFEDFFIKSKPYIFGSSDRAILQKFPSRIFLFPLQFTLEIHRDEKVHKVKINRTENPVNPLVSGETEGRWIAPKEIAYIKIHSFGKPEFEQKAIDYVDEFTEAKTIIFDVRGNGGGSTPLDLVSRIMNRPYRWGMESMPVNFSVPQFYMDYLTKLRQTSPESFDNNSRFSNMYDDFSIFDRPNLQWSSRYITPSPEAYSGNIIILLDGKTASAAEDFIMPFKDNGRAFLIGERSIGSTGQPYMYDFANGMSVFIGMKRVYLPDHTEFEGIGIVPDIELTPTIYEIRKSQDSVFERAIEYAKQNL